MLEASAPSRSPVSLCRLDRLFSDMARSGRKAAGLASARAPVVLDGFGAGGQRAVAVPGLALLVGQVVQRRGEVGQVGGGAGFGQGAVDAGRLRCWRPARRRGPRSHLAGWTGCSATWRGRAGRRRGWLRPGPGRCWTASVLEASAPSRSPVSACWLDRLFSAVARSGR